MEKAGGRPLERFFDRWIFGSEIPHVRVHVTRISGSELKVRFEQQGDVFDIPITVTISVSRRHVGGRRRPAARTRRRADVPLKGAVRTVEVNKDGGALAEIREVGV